jgi:hypothetical protein
MRLRDALALLLRLLPIRWPFTCLVLVGFLPMEPCSYWLMMGLAAGSCASMLGVGAAGLLSVVVDAGTGDGATHAGGWTVSMIAGMGVFLLVCRRWTLGVVCRFRGHVGLLDGVIPVATLGGGTLATLCGGIPSTLGGGASNSRSWGLLQRIFVSLRTILTCFCLSVAVTGTTWRKAVRRSVAAHTVLSCSDTVGILQCDGSRRYVPVILYPFVAGTKNLRSW